MVESYVLMGSNLGDRIIQLSEAERSISQLVGRVIKRSAIYESEAWGMTNTPNFLNQVVSVETALRAEDLLAMLLRIEQDMGRKRMQNVNGYRSRTIDLDVLYYGKEQFESPSLTVPHPRIPERRFVLEPMAEIAGDLYHPELKLTQSELLSRCSDPLQVSVFVE